MIDTAFGQRIQKLSDADLEAHAASAFNSAYYESFGSDYEARADALQEYRMLERERKRRQHASGQSR